MRAQIRGPIPRVLVPFTVFSMRENLHVYQTQGNPSLVAPYYNAAPGVYQSQGNPGSSGASYYPAPAPGVYHVAQPAYNQPQQIYSAAAQPSLGYPARVGEATFFQGDSVTIGVSVYALSEDERNHRIYSDPNSWRCGQYVGKGDTRLWVPNPDYNCCGDRLMDPQLSPNRTGCQACICFRSIPNHAHPTFLKLVAVLFAIVVISNIIRYTVLPRYS